FDPGAGTDSRQTVTVPANNSVSISLQWDDPFFTVNGVNTDLDIYALDGGTAVAGSVDDNLSTQVPNEVFNIVNNTGAAKQYELAIVHASGPVPGRIKYVYHGSMTVNEWATNSPTINPNAASVNAMAVGAIAYYAQESAEQFTSAGPSTILFAPDGTPLGSPEVRQKPDFASIDGTDTTFFGQDAELNGLPNFFGTSAAAPHAAAVAALVKEQFPSLTPAQLYQRLKDLADPSVNTPGFDDLTGSGLINAYDAVFGASTVGPVPFSEGMEGNSLPLTFETHSTGAGRIQVTGAHTPAVGLRHLVLDSSVGLFSRNEVILHVNLAGQSGVTLSFRQKEFNDTDHVMPLSFTGNSNSDGVALSVNGSNWVRAANLTGGNSSNVYGLHSINLSSVASGAGMTLSADTRIKFQQYGNQSAGSGGFAFDTISVTGSNQSPVVQGDKTVTVLEDALNTSLGITAPTDPDGNPLTITVDTVPTSGKGDVRLTGGGTVVAAAQTLTSAELIGLEFDPALNANGAAGTFSYTVADGAGGTASQTVALAITPVNDPPVAQADKALTVLEDAANTSLAITAPVDVDGGAPVIIVATVPDTAKGDVRLSGGGAVVTVGQTLSGGDLTGLQFDPALNANGAAGSFSYNVTDGNGGSASQTVTLAITPVNDLPVAQANKTVTVLEDSANTSLAITAPVDADGDVVTANVTAVPTSAKGDVRLAAGGAVVTAGQALTVAELTGLEFDPALNANGAAGAFTYTVSDGSAVAAGQTVTLEITPQNDAPVVQPDKTVTVAEDDPGTSLAITAPTDADGDSLTITVSAIPNAAKGEVLLSGGSAYAVGNTLTSADLTNLLFRPVADANGSAGTFAYVVTDGNGGSVTQTITLAITPVNDPPTAQADKTVTVAEDAANSDLAISAPADIDGGALTITVTSVPDTTKGDVRLSGGGTVLTMGQMLSLADLTGLEFDPALNANGAAGTFAYSVTDGNGGSASQTVTLVITAVNDPPVVASDFSLTVIEDAANTSLFLTAPTDVDGDTLTITVTSIPDGDLTELQFDPALNANGAAGAFAYTVSDGNGGSAAQTVTLAIIPVNDPPVAPADKTLTVDENSANTALAITAPTDVDGDSLTLTVTAVPNTAKGDVRLTGGGAVVTMGQVLPLGDLTSLEFDPALNANGSAGAFSYSVSDGNGGMASQTVTLEITPGNQPPVVQGNKTITVNEDAANRNLAITAPTDPDGDTLTIVVDSVPDTLKGDVRLAGGGAVVAVGQSLTIAQLTGLQFDAASNANGAAGTFAYTVSDPEGEAASQTVTLVITPVNDRPVAQDSKTVTVLEDSANTPLGITAPTDIENNPLTITVTTLPASSRGVVRLGGGGAVLTFGQSLTIPELTNLEFDPTQDANGVAGVFTYVVSDGQGGFTAQAIVLLITPVNDPPVAQADKTVTVLEDAANTGLGITAPTDIDGGPLTVTVTAVPDPAKGDVRLSGGGLVVEFGQTLTTAQLTTLEFDPALNANGAAGAFAYSVSDGNGGSAAQTVTLVITPVNDAPEAVGESYSTYRATPLSIAAPGVLGNDSDVDGDPLQAIVGALPSGGTLTLNVNGSFVYTPQVGFTGADTFTYRAGDGTATSNLVTVTINVSADPPPSAPDVAADGAGTISVPGGNGSFNFTVRRSTGIIQGSVVYADPNRNRTVTSTQITALVMGAGRAMRIHGKGKLPSGAVVNFVVDVNDLAEPGRLKDMFRIEIGTDGGSSEVAQGTLTTGNIRVNR
ncbi:MAG: outer rane adhesin like protein, partial [Armatimonadetes bacterium]|nr:outer rane adhesin like protein [Armatimonadota bacterium]